MDYVPERANGTGSFIVCSLSGTFVPFDGWDDNDTWQGLKFKHFVGMAVPRCEDCGELPPNAPAQDDPCRWLVREKIWTMQRDKDTDCMVVLSIDS